MLTCYFEIVWKIVKGTARLSRAVTYPKAYNSCLVQCKGNTAETKTNSRSQWSWENRIASVWGQSSGNMVHGIKRVEKNGLAKSTEPLFQCEDSFFTLLSLTNEHTNKHTHTHRHIQTSTEMKVPRWARVGFSHALLLGSHSVQSTVGQQDINTKPGLFAPSGPLTQPHWQEPTEDTHRVLL